MSQTSKKIMLFATTCMSLTLECYYVPITSTPLMRLGGNTKDLTHAWYINLYWAAVNTPVPPSLIPYKDTGARQIGALNFTCTNDKHYCYPFM